jgi:hypothetical protein
MTAYCSFRSTKHTGLEKKINMADLVTMLEISSPFQVSYRTVGQMVEPSNRELWAVCVTGKFACVGSYSKRLTGEMAERVKPNRLSSGQTQSAERPYRRYGLGASQGSLLAWAAIRSD